MATIAANNNRIELGRIGQAAGIAIIGSIIVNLILYFIMAALDIIPSDVIVQGDQGVNAVAVIFSTFVGTTAGSLFFLVLSRFTQNPVRIFQVISVIVLVLSFSSPFSIPDAPTKMIIGLNVLHIAAAAVTIWSFSQLNNE